MTVSLVRTGLYVGLPSDTKPTDAAVGSEFLDTDGNTFTFDGTWQQNGTGGSRHVLIKNASIISQGSGDGGSINFSAAPGTGEIANLGDLTPFGLPYSNVLVTKTGTTAIATATWGVATSGMLFIAISALNALDAINITGVTPTGNTVVGNIYYRNNGGAPANAAITAAAFITLYIGR